MPNFPFNMSHYTTAELVSLHAIITSSGPPPSNRLGLEVTAGPAFDFWSRAASALHAVAGTHLRSPFALSKWWNSGGAQRSAAAAAAQSADAAAAALEVPEEVIEEEVVEDDAVDDGEVVVEKGEAAAAAPAQKAVRSKTWSTEERQALISEMKRACASGSRIPAFNRPASAPFFSVIAQRVAALTGRPVRSAAGLGQMAWRLAGGGGR